MSPIIDKLVKKEFIKKTCLSKDRRYSQISLSEKGRNFLKEHQKSQRLIFMESTTDLPDSDTEKFDQSVRLVKKMMAKIFEKQKDKLVYMLTVMIICYIIKNRIIYLIK